MQNVPKPPKGHFGDLFIAGSGERVKRNQVDLAGQITQQSGQLPGVFIAIINLVYQCIFHCDFATVVGHFIQVAPCAVDKTLQRILAIDRHQLIAQLIVGRMQRDRQGDIGDIAKAIDFRDHSRGAQCYPALGEAVAIVVEHNIHSIDHIVEIHQRFAHTHHHHIGDLARVFQVELVKGFRGDPQLANNFRGGQVAVKALLAGGAETAVQCAANLGGDTEGSAIPLRDIDHFDTAAAIHSNQPFAGAIHRVLHTDNLWQGNFSHFAETGAQCLGDIGHLVNIGNTLLVYPLENLCSTEALLAQRLQKVTYTGSRKPQKVGFLLSGLFVVCCYFYIVGHISPALSFFSEREVPYRAQISSSAKK